METRAFMFQKNGVLMLKTTVKVPKLRRKSVTFIKAYYADFNSYKNLRCHEINRSWLKFLKQNLTRLNIWPNEKEMEMFELNL
jgi:hypothetical protein